MTPEERAEWVFKNQSFPNLPPWAELKERTADAIRAAETDAYERAAQTVEGMKTWDQDLALRLSAEEVPEAIAPKIRALKDTT